MRGVKRLSLGVIHWCTVHGSVTGCCSELHALLAHAHTANETITKNGKSDRYIRSRGTYPNTAHDTRCRETRGIPFNIHMIVTSTRGDCSRLGSQSEKVKFWAPSAPRLM